MEIYEYDYKPEPIFFGESTIGRFFGWEWELSARLGLSESELNRILEPIDPSLYYVKEDCSVDFEVVFHPMAENFFKEQLAHGIGEAMRRASALCDTMYLAGSHLHVSKKSIACNGESVQTVVRNAFAHGMHASDVDRGMSELREWADPDVIGCHTRYAAVNLQNGATIEFRLFGGTNEPEHISRNIDLVNEWIAEAEANPIEIGEAASEESEYTGPKHEDLTSEGRENANDFDEMVEAIRSHFRVDVPDDFYDSRWFNRVGSVAFIIAFAKPKRDVNVPEDPADIQWAFENWGEYTPFRTRVTIEGVAGLILAVHRQFPNVSEKEMIEEIRMDTLVHWAFQQ